MDDVPAMAMAYHDQIVPAMAALRKPVDELELLDSILNFTDIELAQIVRGRDESKN